jgi:hypothetical protein
VLPKDISLSERITGRERDMEKRRERERGREGGREGRRRETGERMHDLPLKILL